MGESRGGTKEDPKPDIPDLANASRAATTAAKALHAAHAGGERGVVDVELGVGGEAARVAVRAAVVGTSAH